MNILTAFKLVKLKSIAKDYRKNLHYIFVNMVLMTYTNFSITMIATCTTFDLYFFQETDDGIDACLESSQDACEGNKDAARATLRVKEKLDGYEAGEIRSVQGQVILFM